MSAYQPEEVRQGPARRPYHRPELLLYGRVPDVIAGGLGSKIENNKGKPGQPMEARS